MRNFESALRFGKPILLENVGQELDPALDPVLKVWHIYKYMSTIKPLEYEQCWINKAIMIIVLSSFDRLPQKQFIAFWLLNRYKGCQNYLYNGQIGPQKKNINLVGGFVVKTKMEIQYVIFDLLLHVSLEFHLNQFRSFDVRRSNRSFIHSEFLVHCQLCTVFFTSVTVYYYHYTYIVSFYLYYCFILLLLLY